MISFVIPAHDEERSIALALASVHAAARALGEPYEVIVVDDASTDRTAEVALAAGARVVPVAHRQISRTRNAGARAARGERLVFVDADTLVSTRLIADAMRALDRGAIGGGAMVRFDGRLPLHAAPVLLLLDAVMHFGRLAAGCFVFCTRAAFERAGGFDESLYAGEELAISVALKRQGRFVMLGTRVVTSGRKLRSHTMAEMTSFLGRIVKGGVRTLQTREGLEVWYGPRREDPEDAKAA